MDLFPGCGGWASGCLDGLRDRSGLGRNDLLWHQVADLPSWR